MDDNTYRTYRNGIIGAVVSVTLTLGSYFLFDYLDKRDLRYAERMTAEVQKEKDLAQIEVDKAKGLAEASNLNVQRLEKIRQLIAEPNYLKYLQARQEYNDKILKDPEINHRMDVERYIVNTAYGDLTLEDIKK